MSRRLDHVIRSLSMIKTDGAISSRSTPSNPRLSVHSLPRLVLTLRAPHRQTDEAQLGACSHVRPSPSYLHSPISPFPLPCSFPPQHPLAPPVIKNQSPPTKPGEPQPHTYPHAIPILPDPPRRTPNSCSHHRSHIASPSPARTKNAELKPRMWSAGDEQLMHDPWF